MQNEILKVVIFFLIWFLLFLKRKKIVLLFPYFIYFWITPFYNLLDRKYFVEIFGCCLSINQVGQEIFTANDLRNLVYFAIWFLLIPITTIISKHIKSKKYRILYIITTILLTYLICSEFISQNLYR